MLYERSHFATADGKAHFVPVAPRGRSRDADTFYVSTRRGKQFNSMVQRAVDPLTGAHRDDVLISSEDAARLGLQNGTPVRLTSSQGSYAGRVMIAPLRAGNVEVHWPEGNALLGPHVDPESHEPDFNAVATLERAQ